MRTSLAVIWILALTGAPLAAPITEGEWYVYKPVFERIQFRGMDFIRWWPEKRRFMECKITYWPLNTPEAKADCEDGTSHVLEIRMDRVIFDGYPLTQTFEETD